MGLFDRFKKEDEVDLNKRNLTYLQHLIKNSNNEIILDSNIILSEDEESKFCKGLIKGIRIKNSKNIIIDGQGHSIDVKNKVILFDVATKNIHMCFKNIHFKNLGDGKLPCIYHAKKIF